MIRQGSGEVLLLRMSPLLKSESIEEFAGLQDALEREIAPRGPIECMYVSDISTITWEILRLRRCKAAIINANYRPALESLLIQVLRAPGQPEYAVKHEAEKLALSWFTDSAVKITVADLLGRLGLDESAIEAEAMRRSAADLTLLERQLGSLEARRYKAVRCIGEYRDSLARKLQKSTDQIIEAQLVPRLTDTSSNQRAPAA